MPQLDTYLFFDGNCAEAMRFYEKTLDGKMETMMTHAESPMAGQCAPGDRDRVMHASLDIGGRKLMASDAMSGQPYPPMQGFSVSIFYDTADAAKRTFAALSEGGTVQMPIDKTFWADAFGMLVDRFGTPWFVSGGAPSA